MGPKRRDRFWWLLVALLLVIGVDGVFAGVYLAQAQLGRHPFIIEGSLSSQLSANYARDSVRNDGVIHFRPALTPSILRSIDRDRYFIAPTPGIDISLKGEKTSPPPAVTQYWQEALGIEVTPNETPAEYDSGEIAPNLGEEKRLRSQGRKHRTRHHSSISKQIRQRMDSVRSCYERALKTDNRLRGRIKVEISVDRHGRVEKARIISDTFKSKAVGRCIVARIRKWNLRPPKAGRISVVIPFTFTPAK